MNKLTKDIAKWLGIDIEMAAKVQTQMSVYWGADFSEDSTASLKMMAKMAYAEMISCVS